MASTSRAQINPEILKNARLEIGLSLEDASKKILSKNNLLAAEEGTHKITFNQLVHLANRYKLPITYFYLEEPRDIGVITKFRSLQSKDVTLSTELRRILMEIDNKRDLMQEISEEAEKFDFSYVNSVSISEDPETIGQKFLKFFKFPTPRSKWLDEGTALKNWLKAFDNIGILVFQFRKVDVELTRGFTISEKPFPTIAINRSDSHLGRIFTLLHEFAHILLDETKFNAFFSYTSTRLKTEMFCNAVAASILMPRNDFLNSSLVKNCQSPKKWSQKDLRKIQREFWISEEALLRRLLTFNKTSKNFYQHKREEWAQIPKMPKSEGFGEHPVDIVIRTQPESFVKSLLSGLSSDKITIAKFSKYLDLKMKHLERLQEYYQ